MLPLDAADIADPERALAVSYAPAAARAGVAALFALDERLGAIVAAAREPMIGLMRLTWWRDALAALDRAEPPAEPLLQALAAHVVAGGVDGATLAALEDGWAALLDGDLDDAALQRHATARGSGLFDAAARLLGVDDPRIAPGGAAWALADLAHRVQDPAARERARARGVAALAGMPGGRWPRRARALGALVALARRDARAQARQQGAPGRLLRMLALRLTGV